MGSELMQADFQARVFASYEAICSTFADFPPLPLDPQQIAAAGPLAGRFIVSDSLLHAAAALPVASLLAGACFLGMDASPDAATSMLRQGRCDFVVNSLDEALRILKNELRQKKPVAVCLVCNVAAVLENMADRGVSPELLMHVLSPSACPALQRLSDTGSLLCQISNLAAMLDRSANQDGDLLRWSLPDGNSTMLARLDLVARETLPPGDRKRRRWFEAAARYLPREHPPSRVGSLTPVEVEKFVDGVSARLMSRDVTGPVHVTLNGQEMVLGNEAVA